MSTILTAERIATYTLTESNDRYSTYLDADGREIHLSPTGMVMVRFADLDVLQSWRDYCNRGYYQQDLWLRRLADELIDPDALRARRAIQFCGYCGNIPFRQGDGTEIEGGGAICGECTRYYHPCTDCSIMSSTLAHIADSDARLCTACRERVARYCGNCGIYYWIDDADEHDHSSCRERCASPQLEFSIRNGDGRLAAGDRAQFDLPEGVISGEGMEQINLVVRDFAANLSAYEHAHRGNLYGWAQGNHMEEAIGNEWAGKRGNFPKRLSAFIYKQYEIKLDPDVVTRIGNIAREQSEGGSLVIDITRDLNLPAAEFAHEGSCWWQSYFESRCAMKSSGGFGMRSWSGLRSRKAPTGRAWVLPLKNTTGVTLTPTFNDDPDAFVVFNCYGLLSGTTPARLLSGMTGLTYKKIRFSCSPMYVNGTMGYLVANGDLTDAYAASSTLTLAVSAHSDLHTIERRELTNAV